MARFRFMSWNVCWSTPARDRHRQVELVREIAPDLLALQEVRQPVVRRFAALFAWEVFAIGPVPGDRYWKTRQGTAVLGGHRTRLEGQELIAPTWFDLPDEQSWKANRFSRRATWARVSIDGCGQTLQVGSLHASPATKPILEHKPWFHGGVARWLQHRDEPWLFGIDANAPGRDHPDITKSTWGWPARDGRPGEDQLLGASPAHRGRDLLRDWLSHHSDELDALVRQRPNGPLAVSYHLGGGPVRYDHVWATTDVQVDRIDYLSDGPWHSDHAPVVCDLRLVSRDKRPRTARSDSQTATTSAPTRPAPAIPPNTISAGAPPDGSTHQNVRALLDELDHAGVRDGRGHPSPGRRRQFTSGWNDRLHRDRHYHPRTLRVLTWRNLGYRLAGLYTAAHGEQPARRDDLYDVAAQGHTDGTLTLALAVTDSP